MMNMLVLEKSRKKPKSGDFFGFQMLNGECFGGRVIRADARIGPMQNCLLIYIYNQIEDKLEALFPQGPDNLLLPPLLTNKQPWLKGYFKTISHIPLDVEDVLPCHCFWDFRRSYFDEYNNKLFSKASPCGEYGLQSYRTIDDLVSIRLKLPLPKDEFVLDLKGRKFDDALNTDFGTDKNLTDPTDSPGCDQGGLQST